MVYAGEGVKEIRIMDRYTEYHAGVPVIRDKELLPGAIKKLAMLEDHLEEIRETMCDEFCKFPDIFPEPEILDHFCEKCKMAKLFEALR